MPPYCRVVRILPHVAVSLDQPMESLRTIVAEWGGMAAMPAPRPQFLLAIRTLGSPRSRAGGSTPSLSARGRKAVRTAS